MFCGPVIEAEAGLEVGESEVRVTWGEAELESWLRDTGVTSKLRVTSYEGGIPNLNRDTMIPLFGIIWTQNLNWDAWQTLLNSFFLAY